MDTFPVAEQFEIMSLIRCRVKKSREPNQRNRNLAAVGQGYRELVVAY